MGNSIKITITFMLGLLIGAGGGIATGILLTKSKYEKKADDEIESVKKVYSDYFKQKDEKNEVITPEKEPHETRPMTNKGVVDYSKAYKSDDGSPVPEIDKSSLGDTNNDRYKHICLISPESFRESDYQCVSLIYYTDKVLADDDNNVIHVPEELIGDEALESFGRYEDDCVYVRDTKKKVDYEIIKSDKAFEDVLSIEREEKYP